MAKQKHASEQSDAIAGAHDQTHAIALELLGRLSMLRLVYRAIDGVEHILPNNKELSAARSQLSRLLGQINNLHNRADLLSGLLSRCMETGATALECVGLAAQAVELPGGTARGKTRRLS
jgi:hypothetical protein